MSTKAEMLVDPGSCFSKAAHDEPLFVLRANDPAAAHVVRLWATVAPLRGHSAAKAAQAHKVADEMIAWYASKYPRPAPPVRDDTPREVGDSIHDQLR